jgi:hypothetical protein
MNCKTLSKSQLNSLENRIIKAMNRKPDMMIVMVVLFALSVLVSGVAESGLL